MLAAVDGEDGGGGVNLKTRDLGVVRGAGGEGRARADPIEDRAVVFGVRVKALAAAVGDSRGGLEEEETLGGIGKIDARDALTFDLGSEDLVAATLGDPFEVVGGVEGVGGEF